jgi:hypothetical protein
MEIYPISASWIARQWRCNHGRAASEVVTGTNDRSLLLTATSGP